MDDRMVWIDLEMTGLDIERESIIEIATIVTDGELNTIAVGPNLAIKVPEELIEGMDEWNTEHHFSSGLIDRVRNDSVELEEAIKQTCDFLKEYVIPGKAPLCGNSVHNDRVFMIKEMPEVLELLHYRIVDVSTIKELCRRWYPNMPEYNKKEAHLALDDIIESIEELRFLREQVFVKD